MLKEWVEENIHGPYLFACINCGSTKIKRRISYSYFGPPTDLSECAKCGWGNWAVKEKRIAKDENTIY